MIFQYGLEPVLIQWILIGLVAIIDKSLPILTKDETYSFLKSSSGVHMRNEGNRHVACIYSICKYILDLSKMLVKATRIVLKDRLAVPSKYHHYNHL